MVRCKERVRFHFLAGVLRERVHLKRHRVMEDEPAKVASTAKTGRIAPGSGHPTIISTGSGEFGSKIVCSNLTAVIGFITLEPSRIRATYGGLVHSNAGDQRISIRSCPRNIAVGNGGCVPAQRRYFMTSTHNPRISLVVSAMHDTNTQGFIWSGIEYA